MLTKSQLIDRIPELRAAIQAGGELTRLDRAHIIQLMMVWETYLHGELEELDELIDLVSKVKLQSEAFRKALLWDLRGYGGASPEDRRKTKDRVFKALGGPPPSDPKVDDMARVQEVSGHEMAQPDRFSK